MVKLAAFRSVKIDYSVFQVDPQSFQKFCLLLIFLGAVISAVSILGPVIYFLNNAMILQAVTVFNLPFQNTIKLKADLPILGPWVCYFLNPSKSTGQKYDTS